MAEGVGVGRSACQPWMLGSRVFDGWPHRASWRGSRHPGSLLFNTLLISFIPHQCRFHAQQCRAHRPNSGPGRRLCQGVSRQRSVSAWFTTGHDRGCRPHEGGLAQHLLSEGTAVLDLAAWLFNDCISILWRLTGTLSGPTFVPPQYQNVFVSCPQPRPLLSPLTWRGKVRW